MDERREAVVRVAHEWLGTPFRHKAALKGVATDCAGILVGVYKEAGVLPPDFVLGNYNYQHALHHSEELYIGELQQYMKIIPESEAQPGDIVLYRHDRTFSHSGIIINWPTIIHAVRWGVCLADGNTDAAVQGRKRLFFTFKD